MNLAAAVEVCIPPERFLVFNSMPSGAETVHLDQLASRLTPVTSLAPYTAALQSADRSWWGEKQGCAPEKPGGRFKDTEPMIKDCLMLQEFSFFFCLFLPCYLPWSDACRSSSSSSSSSSVYCLLYVFKQLLTFVNQFGNDSKCNLLVLNIRWLKLKIEPPADYRLCAWDKNKSPNGFGRCSTTCE